MDIQAHTTPDRLERYAFLWSLARMVIGALSLFLGASPIFMGAVGPGIMQLAWLISGASAIYLGYLWYKGGQTIFGGKDKKDTWMFLIMVISGINLGYTAIGTNIGMSTVYTVIGMSLADVIFKATALAYLYVAYSLYTRWKARREKVF